MKAKQPKPIVLTDALVQQIVNATNQEIEGQIPEGVREIRQKCFKNTGIRQIYIPASTIVVRQYAFLKCERLAKVTFMGCSQLKEIQDSAFYGCT